MCLHSGDSGYGCWQGIEWQRKALRSTTPRPGTPLLVLEPTAPYHLRTFVYGTQGGIHARDGPPTERLQPHLQPYDDCTAGMSMRTDLQLTEACRSGPRGGRIAISPRARGNLGASGLQLRQLWRATHRSQLSSPLGSLRLLFALFWLHTCFHFPYKAQQKITQGEMPHRHSQFPTQVMFLVGSYP